jgi:hypothetical protein
MLVSQIFGWSVCIHALPVQMLLKKKKTIFHNGFVCHSTASWYLPSQTKHFVTLLFSPVHSAEVSL